jgi:hypothetical protein
MKYKKITENKNDNSFKSDLAQFIRRARLEMENVVIFGGKL